LFVNCVDGIYYGTNCFGPSCNTTKEGSNTTNNEETMLNKFLDVINFIIELSGFSVVHHVDNFIFCLLFTSSLIFLPIYLCDYWNLKEQTVKRTVLIMLYFLVILNQIAFATLWELYEKFIIKFFKILLIFFPQIKPIEYLASGGETLENSMLNDIPQSILASILVILFIHYDIIRPVSYNLYDRSFIAIFLRFICYGLGGLSAIMSHLKKRYRFSPYIFHNGFYAHFFARIFTLTILYIDDIHSIEKKQNKGCSSCKLKSEKRNIHKFWIILYIYIIIMWISSLDLHIWGFVSSNFFGFVYFIILLSFKFAKII
jgi:hypothetical protein